MAALRTLQKVAKRGGVRTRAVIDAVTKLIRQGASMDVVAKVCVWVGGWVSVSVSVCVCVGVGVGVCVCVCVCV